MSDFNKHYQDGRAGRMFSGRTFTDSVTFDEGRAASQQGGAGGGGLFLVAIALGALVAPFAVILAAIAQPLLAARLRQRGETPAPEDLLRPAFITAFAVMAVHAVLLVFSNVDLLGVVLAAVVVTEAAATLVAGVVLQRQLGGSFRQAARDAAVAFIAPTVLMLAFIGFGYAAGTPFDDTLVTLLLGAGLWAAMVATNIGLAYAAVVKLVFHRPFGTALVTAFAAIFSTSIVAAVICYFFQTTFAMLIALVLGIALCRVVLRWEGLPTKWWHRLPAAVILGASSAYVAVMMTESYA